jgi:threonine-phosphate decarboxylase
LSKQLGVSRDAIVVGPGAEALLTPIMRCVGANRALVPIPSFSEYRRVCSRERIEFIPFPLDRGESFQVSVDRFCARIEAVTPGLVLLNNPHNPSGALLQAKEVRRIAETAISVGATLVLDEAFIDYAPEATLIREAAEKLSLIVIRSLTKFYGCPALRVGYAVAHPDAIRSIRSYLPTWPVTQFALDALSEAVTDVEFAETSLRENATERERLASALAALGLVVFSSAANYLLLELRDNMPSASELRERLIAAHRIAIRNCDSYEGLAHGRFVRVAVRSAADNDRLIGALQRELT